MADKRHYREEDYLYASAYIRSVENRGLSDMLIKKMLDSPDADAAIACLFEARSALEGAGAAADDADALCDEFLNDSFRVISEVTSDPSVFDFMRYQYDCNNVKTALKCRAKGIGTEGLLFACGTVPPEKYAKMAENDDFSPLPELLAKAAKTASDTYKKTGDPQSIDLTLDLACLEAMTKSVKAVGDPLLTRAVMLRTDLSNIMAALRILRMQMADTAEAELLERVLCPFGSIPKELLKTAAAEGEEQLFSAVKDLVPQKLGDRLTVGVRLSELECAADNAYLAFVDTAKSTVFGVSVPFSYLTGREYNAKNARIIIAGKRAGLPYDEIAMRVRTAG